MEKDYRSELRKNGWVLIKNFFDEEFCERLRNECVVSTKNGLTEVDLLSNKFLDHLFVDQKFIEQITQLLGGKPVYFGDSGFQIASVTGRISNGFHKDSVDRKNPNGKDWGEDYSIIRVGIYLQDHKDHSEGLVVRNGSHKSIDLTVGKKVNVPSQKGDLIVWYLTTTHSGNAKKIKFIDYPVLMGDDTGGWLSHKLYYHLPKIFIQPSEKDRIALFLTFAKRDIHFERYLKYLKHRAYMIKMWRTTKYADPTITKIKGMDNLEVINMKEEADKIDLKTLKEYDFNEHGKFNI